MIEEKRKINLTAPIVLEKKKNKKKKKRYSRGFEDIQIVERHLTRASHRAVRSMEKGLTTYQKSRNKSARKVRDGAVVDFVPNVAKGVGRTVRAASSIPYELAKAAYPKPIRRIVRGQVRIMSRLLSNI